MSLALTLLFSAVMMLAAACDIRSRTIPNLLVLAVLLLFVPWWLTAAARPLWDSMAAGTIMLGVSLPLFAMHWIGAGDSKLAAAAALYAGLHRLDQFLLVMSLVGGMLAVLALATRYWRRMQGQDIVTGGVPYGVAIAFAGVVTVLAGG